MTSFFQKIVAFFTAIVAFISGLLGLNKDKPEPEPTTMMEETTRPIDPAELRLEPEILSEARTILHNPGSIYCYFAWPSIARLKDGRLAVTCSGFRRDHLCPFGQAVMITSADEGKTWSAPVAVIETPLDDRDAGVVPFGENGVIVTSFTNTRAEQRAWNPGNAEFMAYLDTITDEDEARYLGSTFRMSFDGGNTFGDIRISPVTSPHGPMELSDGTLLWVGRTYPNTDLPEEKKRIEAWRIATDGTMTFVGAVPQVYRDGRLVDFWEPHAVELPDGTLLCHIRDDNHFTIYQTRSADGGRTWSEPVQLLADRGGSPPHLFLHSSGVLICSYGYRNEPYGVRLMLSTDGGQTWKKDLALWETDVSFDLGYPATAELRDGTLLTVFYAIDAVDSTAVIKQIRWRLD